MVDRLLLSRWRFGRFSSGSSSFCFLKICSGGPHAGQQCTPYMYVLVCICSNVRQVSTHSAPHSADLKMYNYETATFVNPSLSRVLSAKTSGKRFRAKKKIPH